MSSANHTSAGHSRGCCFSGDGQSPCGGHWSGANIAAMVLGFIVFAPLGLAILAWTLFGRPVQDLPGWVRDRWNAFSGGHRSYRGGNDSDNQVFNEYQQAQHDRIREIREEIGKRAEAFRRFRFDAKRRKDRQEFDDFMSGGPKA